MKKLRIAAFPNREDAFRARRALEADATLPDAPGPVLNPPDYAPELRERPFVRRRAMRGGFVGLAAGLLFGAVIAATYWAAGFDTGLWSLLALVGLMSAAYGATTGWLWGAASAHRALYRLARHQPDPSAFLTLTMNSPVTARRFEEVCDGYGALAVESA